MNVISVMGGKVHKRQEFDGGEESFFPLCRTGGMTNRGTKYKGTDAEVTCSVCLSYDAPAETPEEAPKRTVTREEWLHLAIDALRPEFAKIGLPLPARVHVSVGFGYGAKRESAKILGQCWARRVSEDDVNHIFISPELKDEARVLDVLIHELVHAADDCQSGHKGRFATAAKALGLTGKMTATVASPELAAKLRDLAKAIGPYAHATLYPMGKPIQPKADPKPEGPEETPEEPPISSGPKKQGTRMIKVVCKSDCGCGGYVVRTTAKWLEVGFPICPAGTVMELAV
ncbi:SprT-like domain-containing protein [Streptomyces antimicrobicus]|uniref:SprT-like domain-containing protein n=1 Tax=Streptomyces antimicrobicus TaxID=2883108 RepID=A0ABS8B4L6_9ACTN|nr:SprT-like domain-containing protein [Streptomyces antimicrobicus]MCB5179529.1 SprT-like domain-containing protein [Streptomyces antimicrobicus]